MDQIQPKGGFSFRQKIKENRSQNASTIKKLSTPEKFASSLYHFGGMAEW